MNTKAKKDQDSLAALQRDINTMGFSKYIKAKKAKVKADKQKKRKEKQNTTDQASGPYERLPSLYQRNGGAPKKYGSAHTDPSKNLFQRIKQFENRILDLQTENAIQKRQNEKLIDHVAFLKNGQRVPENRRPRDTQPVIHQPLYPQFPPPYQYPPFMQPMMPIQNMNPYQMPFSGQQTLYQQSPPKQTKKSKIVQKKAKLGLLSRFRVAGYVIFFTFFIRKYAKSFTLNRFDHFKENWCGWESVTDGRQNLSEFFREHLSLDVFEKKEINQLDSLRNIDEQNQQKSEKKTKNGANKGESDSDSADSSDLQSSEQDKNQSKKQSNIDTQKESKVFEFYLKIDIAVAFVVQFIKQIAKTIERSQFEQKNQFLMFLLPRQFQLDKLHQESDLKYLNLHQQKGYSQNQKVVSEYLLIKNIFLCTFVENSLLSEFGKKFYFENQKKTNQSNQNRVFFSFFIRTSIFKIMVQQYLKKKIQKVKQFPLPEEQLQPFTRELSGDNPLKNRVVSFENNGIDMKQQNIQEISQDQIRKKQKDLKQILDECAGMMLKKFYAYRKKKQFLPTKEKTLSQKYRQEDNNYFKLHQKQDFEIQRNKKVFIKTSKSVFQSGSIASSMSISIVKRLPKSVVTIKETQKKIPEKAKTTKKKLKQQSEQQD